MPNKINLLGKESLHPSIHNQTGEINNMKNILVVCLLLLFGEALMAQENVLFSLAPQHEVSGYAGTIVAYTKLFSLPNGRYGSNKAALP